MKRAILIITVAMAIRLIDINQPLLEFFPQRQTQTAEITRNIYKNGAADFWTPKVRYFTAGQPIPYVLEFPLYNGIIALLYHAFGPNVIIGRLVSLIFFVGSSIVFYKLLFRTYPDFSSEKSAGTPEPRSHALRLRGRRPRDEVSVLWGSFLFFIFSPIHILTSRSFQPEELALFLLLLAVYKKSWAVFSLAVLTKLPLVFFAPVMFYTSNNKCLTFASLQKSDICQILRMMAALFPAAVWYLRASRLTVHPAIARNFDITNWFQPQLWLSPNWYFSLFQIEHIWILTTLGLFFFWLGLWKSINFMPKLLSKLANLRVRLLPSEATRAAARRGGLAPSPPQGDERVTANEQISANEIAIWLVWLLSGFLYLAIFNYHAMTHEYYHLFLVPPLSAIAGLGLSSILSDVAKHRSKSVFTAGVILMLVVSLSQPAIRKIITAPQSPEESTEITPERYRLIEDY